MRSAIIVRSKSGRLVGRIWSVVSRITARSNTFRSSRTLPGHECASSADWAFTGLTINKTYFVVRTNPAGYTSTNAIAGTGTNSTATKVTNDQIKVVLANNANTFSSNNQFLAWVAAHTPTPPESYRTIKLANLGLVDVAEADAEVLEAGPSQCAIG